MFLVLQFCDGAFQGRELGLGVGLPPLLHTNPLFHHRFYKHSLSNHLGFVSTLGAEMYFIMLTKRVIRSNRWE